MGQGSLGDNSSFGDDCTQLVTSETHTVNNNSSVNDGDNEERTVIHDEGERFQ
jgi:hypothetical protein